MSGYQTYQQYQRIEDHANKLGFRLGNPRGHWTTTEDRDMVSLYPADQALPIYNPDAEIFTGTFGQVEIFLKGWDKAQQYDYMLRMSDDKKRKKYELKEVERQRLAKERLEKKQMFAILSDKKEEDVERLL